MSTARQPPCLGRIGVATVCVWLLLTPAGAAAVDLLKPTDLDSPGAIALRKLSKDVINAPKPKRFSLEAQREQERSAASNTEDILVLADRETDDVISKRVGMAAFRDRLARERPSTPKEKVQRALCFIGLCAVEPVENTAFTRAEQGTDKSSLQLSTQFRGTLQ